MAFGVVVVFVAVVVVVVVVVSSSASAAELSYMESMLVKYLTVCCSIMLILPHMLVKSCFVLSFFRIHTGIVRVLCIAGDYYYWMEFNGM